MPEWGQRKLVLWPILQSAEFFAMLKMAKRKRELLYFFLQY